MMPFSFPKLAAVYVEGGTMEGVMYMSEVAREQWASCLRVKKSISPSTKEGVRQNAQLLIDFINAVK